MQTLLAPFRVVLRLPQPLQTAFWLAMAASVIMFVGTLTSPADDEASHWFMLPFILVMLSAGLLLALNFRGNASRTVEVARQEGAVVFPVILVRFLGAGIVAVGVMFVWLIVSGRA